MPADQGLVISLCLVLMRPSVALVEEQILEVICGLTPLSVLPAPLPHCSALSYTICALGVPLFSSVRTRGTLKHILTRSKSWNLLLVDSIFLNCYCLI